MKFSGEFQLAPTLPTGQDDTPAPRQERAQAVPVQVEACGASRSKRLLPLAGVCAIRCLPSASLPAHIASGRFGRFQKPWSQQHLRGGSSSHSDGRNCSWHKAAAREHRHLTRSDQVGWVHARETIECGACKPVNMQARFEADLRTGSPNIR